MKLSYEKTNSLPNSYVTFSQDKSFSIKNVYFDIQVALSASRSIILNFDKYLLECVSCEGYLISGKIKNEPIEIGKYFDAKLKIDLHDDELKEDFFEYLIDNTIIFDNIRKRYLFGRINQDICIRFLDGLYASFENEKLVGIVIEIH